MAKRKKRANAVPLACRLRVIRPRKTNATASTRMKIEMELDRDSAMALAGKIVRHAE